MKEIILLGPIAVGKTTTAKLLSKKLNKPFVSIDDLRFDYYKEIGYDHDHMVQIHEKAGIFGVFQYGKIFDSHSIERILEDHSDCVFDFGGGNIVSSFSFDSERIIKALAPYKNIVLMLPCDDKEESLEFIFNRRDVKESDKEFIRYLVFNHANEKIANHTVYVKGKTPEEVCNEIISITQ